MVTVGTIQRLEVKPGNEASIEQALRETFSKVQQEPATSAWFAVRQGPTTFNIFDAFPDEAARQARLVDERLEQVSDLLAQPRSTEKIQVFASKLPALGTPRAVTVGFLSRFKAKPGKEAEVEQGLHGTLSAIQQLPVTIAWFAWRLGPSTFGTVDLFLDEAGREAHRKARSERIQTIASQLFVEGSLAIDAVDILSAKLPS